MTILGPLLRLGVQPDPDDPAVPNNVSFSDEYLRYPIVFTKR